MPIERAAAEIMLDEVHHDLPYSAQDTNTYMYGNIRSHNIVIACLAEYGPVNAALVLSHLKRTFQDIRIILMVGIGGGVPSLNADIRLGDIVVGTRVMPYDLAKVGRDGVIERVKDVRTLNKAIGTAVSALRAKHELDGSRIQSLIADRLQDLPEYGRPKLQDRLFQATYNHEPSSSSCDECDPGRTVRRPKRTSDAPRIHYGAIASGHLVIKDAATRDQYARSLGRVMCFEMEASGLLDELPCLPIRGICDYCDTHKNKDWQRYASAAAAAYAREFVEDLPLPGSARNDGLASTSHNPDPYPIDTDTSPDLRMRRILGLLNFSHINFRKTTISSVHAKTCDWILLLPEYEQWLNHEEVGRHGGFLWIRGKPGVGKSTLMKFIYMHMMKGDKPGHSLTIGFFFHARGVILERSTSGMLRSLLFQLLRGFPSLLSIIEGVKTIPGQLECPPLNSLKTIFEIAIRSLGTKSLTCYVDALDECDEQQVVDMVQYFESLSGNNIELGIRFKVCFSSRHYPYIDVQAGIRVMLESQPGHTDDLAQYIQAKLRIKNPAVLGKLQSQLIQKSAGVFLWVKLVVDILNKEARRGQFALQKKLSEVPEGLTNLFKDIISRDLEDMEDFKLSIIWILCANRSLRPDEYYHAIWSGLAMSDLADDKAPDMLAADPEDIVETSVISTSKGLAEIAKGASGTVVQFIHESVRDFLIRDEGLYELWPDWAMYWEVFCNETIKKCCNFYLNYTLGISPPSPPQTYKFPCLEYATINVLHHAEVAAKAYPQNDFPAHFRFTDWRILWNSIPTRFVQTRFIQPRFSNNASMLFVVVSQGYSRLTRATMENNPLSIKYVLENMFIDPGEVSMSNYHRRQHHHPFFAALGSHDPNTMAALLGSQTTIFHGFDIMKAPSFLVASASLSTHNHTPLTWAAEQGYTGFVTWALDAGVAVNRLDSDNRSAISRAIGNGQVDTVRALIKHHADLEVGDHPTLPLILATIHGHLETMAVLLDHEVKADLRDFRGWTALLYAAYQGNEKGAKLLIEHGANVNEGTPEQRTSLILAAMCGNLEAAKLLISHGANVDHADKDGNTALMWAVRQGDDESIQIKQLLITHHANLELVNNKGKTAEMLTN